MYKVELSEYKGKPVMAIKDNAGRIIVSFGLRKALAIIQNIDSIRNFVESLGDVKTNKNETEANNELL